MSRADFIALAAVVAVRAASDQQDCRALRMPPNCDPPQPEMRILYGRRDCLTSPDSPLDSGFPDPHRDLEHVMEVFRDGMSMTERQVVALIGAHTMGMATPRNSGFQGPWAPPANRFDNAFFRTLVSNNSQWHQSELNFRDAPMGFNPRYQWDLGNVVRTPQGPPPQGVRMMLNTDMVWIVKKIHYYVCATLTSFVNPAYRICSIGCRGYYLFHDQSLCGYCLRVATSQERCLFTKELTIGSILGMASTRERWLFLPALLAVQRQFDSGE